MDAACMCMIYGIVTRSRLEGHPGARDTTWRAGHYLGRDTIRPTWCAGDYLSGILTLR